jgi:hypothetical protein
MTPSAAELAQEIEWDAAERELRASGDDAETIERRWRDRFGGIPGGFAVLAEDYGDDPPPVPPVVERRGVSRDLWMVLMRGQLTPDTPGIGPRRAGTVVTVAFFLASWANGEDGRRARPGEVNLCAATGFSARAVRAAVRSLDDAGWITRVRRRNRRAGLSDEYRLTVPADVAAAYEARNGDEP